MPGTLKSFPGQLSRISSMVGCGNLRTFKVSTPSGEVTKVAWQQGRLDGGPSRKKNMETKKDGRCVESGSDSK